MTAPELCPIAHWCPAPMMTAAFACSAGTAAPAGSQSCQQCEFGVSADGSHCITSNFTCARGFGKTNVGCVMCSAGFFSDGKGPCRQCAASTYTNVNATAECLPCDDVGLMCDLATGRAFAKDGFSAYSWPGDRQQVVHTVACVQPELCRSGSAKSWHRTSACRYCIRAEIA